MKQIDPRKLQGELLKHKKMLEKPRVMVDTNTANSAVISHITKLKSVVANLDGSELATLKREIHQLYELAVHLQLAHGEAQNFQLGNVFVVRKQEQELLMLRELKRELGEALDNLGQAVLKKDLLRAFSYLGGIMGAVGE